MDARNSAQVHRKDAENVQEPKNDDDNDDDVQDVLNLAIHRNVSVGQPEEQPDHDENDDDSDYWHSKSNATRPSDGCLFKSEQD